MFTVATQYNLLGIIATSVTMQSPSKNEAAQYIAVTIILFFIPYIMSGNPSNNGVRKPSTATNCTNIPEEKNVKLQNENFQKKSN